ncbi:MAG: hypothetical protein ACOYJE_02955 [Bacteroidaceae bacterium]|jgi:hypothetical protein
MDLNRIRLILNSLFMIGAVAVVVLYFTVPASNPVPMFVVGTLAVVVKFSEYVIRVMQNARERNNRSRRKFGDE